MSSKLIAIRIRRRSVAVAIFSCRSLDYVNTLHLCDEQEAVTDAASWLICDLIDSQRPDSAAIGLNHPKEGTRVAAITAAVEAMLRTAAIPTWKVADQLVLETFAVPRLKSKRQLRTIMASFWPELGHKQLAAYEAMALGLHVQTDRLLSHY